MSSIQTPAAAGSATNSATGAARLSAGHWRYAPGLRAITGGSFDNPDWYRIESHIWTRSARHDKCFPNHLPIHEQAMPPA